MYGYIQKACYFRLVIDKKSFNKVLRDCSDNKKNDVKEAIKIKLKDTPKVQKVKTLEVEFIRLMHAEWYIDIAIKKFISEQGFIIQLGRILDHNAKITHTNTK